MTTMQFSSDFIDSCPECDSLNIRAVDTMPISSEELEQTDWPVEVYCQDCGADWRDYVQAR